MYRKSENNMKKLILTLSLSLIALLSVAQGNSYSEGTPEGTYLTREVYFPPLYNKVFVIYKVHDTMKFEFTNCDTLDASQISKLMLPGSNTQVVKADGSFGSLTSGMITTGLGYTPYNSTNPNGYVTTNNVYTNGFGISKTGTEPNVTFSVNTSDIMTVNRAADSITALNANINGKVPQSRTLQFVAGSGISISPTGAQNLSANRTFTITATGSNPGATTFEGIGTGTTYNLTTTSAKVDFGTTDPSITLTSPGTYMIVTNVKLDYAGLTTLGASTSTLKVRRTNNTATDLATTGFTTPVLTLLTATAGDCDIRTFIYTTSNSNDVLEVWGNRGANVTVGNVVVSEASIIAIKIN